jgi:hypothetical protein
VKFEKIGHIDINDDKTWKEAVFITLDMDWANDAVMNYVLDLIENAGVNCTIFVTHETSAIERMKKMNNVELGIHPNFNFLLQGDQRFGKTAYEVVNYFKEIVPEAVSARSHSITQGSIIYDAYIKNGIQFDCNSFIPSYTKIKLRPWKEDYDLIKVPYCWADDLHMEIKDGFEIDSLLKRKGLKVLDIHPIHIYLNTEMNKRYNKARPYLDNLQKLQDFVNHETFGTGDFFKKLISKGRLG